MQHKCEQVPTKVLLESIGTAKDVATHYNSSALSINSSQQNNDASHAMDCGQNKNSSNSLHHLSKNSTVVNLSQLVLDDNLKLLLEKGLNFAVSPAKIPIYDIISNIEVIIKNNDQNKAEEIRQDVSRILRNARPTIYEELESESSQASHLDFA